MRHKLLSMLAASLAAVVALAGCTVQETPAPPLAGPSEFALALAMQAVPDSITQDGASQSGVTIEARGPDGRPVRALAIRIEIVLDGVIQDHGTLSSRTVVTGDDGRARLTYTAPPRPMVNSDTGTIVTLRATPVGGDYRGEWSRQVDIRLIPPGVIVPPPASDDPPVASFVITPTPVPTLTPVTFDASGTTDDGVLCGTRCTYSWSFGDGGSGSGQIVTREYRAAGTFTVALTATDQGGKSHRVTQTVTVSQVSAPSASFIYSPNNPAVSQDIFFSAEASRAQPGRTIVGYDWNFGSGRTGSGVTIAKRYDTAGTYTVTLSVTDDANQVGTTTQQVTVGSSGTGPQPALTFSPSAPDVNTTIFFDASGTRGPSPITEYRFTWGDNSADTIGTAATVQHRFATAGTYTVRLTVRDSANRTATTTASVTVASSATQLVPLMTFSPTSPRVGTSVFFDASASRGPSPITSYEFTWGDGTSNSGTSAQQSHVFSAIGTYVVRLTVRDGAGGVASTTINVTVAP